MKRALVAAIKSPASGRQIFLVCLNCAQAIAPDWPLLVLWPFLKLTLASSMASVSGRKNRRAGLPRQSCA